MAKGSEGDGSNTVQVDPNEPGFGKTDRTGSLNSCPSKNATFDMFDNSARNIHFRGFFNTFQAW